MAEKMTFFIVILIIEFPDLCFKMGVPFDRPLPESIRQCDLPSNGVY
jgi:hypothetical protein